MKTFLFNIWLAINQGMCLIVTGQNDITISGYSYVVYYRGSGSFWYKFVNKLFFWQKDHCKSAFLWEYEAAQTMCTKYERMYADVRSK